MTGKIFWKNPYQTKLETQITSADGNIITLADTIFYAFAGGQESDAGTIDGISVIEAEKQDTQIFYTVIDGHDFQVNQDVSVKIDWERRYKLMRLHFAAEIILELAYQNLEGIEKIGAHIAEDKSRIDFLWGESIRQSFPILEEEAQEIIQANHGITSDFSNRENERRYWQIDNFAKVACGGTHLKSTGEIGQIRLKRNNIGKGKERVEIYLVD